MTLDELDTMSRMDIRKIDRNTLVDIRNIHIDVNMPIKERIEKYFSEVKNPYCFMVGDVPVQIGFNPNGKTLYETLKNHLISQK